MKKRRMVRLGIALMLLGAVAGLNSAAVAAPVSHAVVCTSASAWTITPTEGGGASFAIANGAGYCLQSIPFEGDWSFIYQGTGSAASLSCTPLLGLVSGLKLDVAILFHNNKNGNTETVHETWTQLLPVSPLSVATMTIAPNGFLAQLETRVFLACPGASPSSYVQWLDANPPR